MENVPLEAWNEDGVRLILGDCCVLDRLDSRTIERETSRFLTCWVWMEDPSDLPRSMDFTLFAARAGQAMEVMGLSAPARIPSIPPKGKLGERAILIHLAGYGDWRPRSPGVGVGSSGTSSETGNSAPVTVPFTWTPGVLDGRQPGHGRQRPQGCHPAAPPPPRRDDEGRGLRPRDNSTKNGRVR